MSIVIRRFKKDLISPVKKDLEGKRVFTPKTAKKEGIRGSDHHKKYDEGNSRKN